MHKSNRLLLTPGFLIKTWALILCLLLAACISAGAAPKPSYTLSKKNVTVLQNVPDREIAPKTGAIRHELIPGESPTTGLPWEGEYLPMLVQIGNPIILAKINGRDIKSAGIGSGAPWGAQYADVVFEGGIFQSGDTRLAFLFSDSFAQGQPEKGVGPVRSTRIGQLLLREEWQAGFVYAGGSMGGWRDDYYPGFDRQTGVSGKGVLFNLFNSWKLNLHYRVSDVKSRNNINVNIIGFRNRIPESYAAQPRPFLFADESPYGDAYATAQAIHLDWGIKWSISHFKYDENENVYLRFCGAGMDEKKWAPYLSFASAEDRSEENQQQLSFSNLIIQRVTYEYAGGNVFVPNMQSIGKGNADIFIGGRYIPGYWVRNSLEDPTVFYDDQGNELQLNRGKTFIAHFPPEALCTFQ